MRAVCYLSYRLVFSTITYHSYTEVTYTMPDAKLIFSVETFAVDDNRSLKACTQDKNGYFMGVPVAALSKVTRNNTHYNVDSIISSISDEGSPFKMRLEEGNLFGEWGHPRTDVSTREGMTRLLDLDPTKEACHYRRVYSEYLSDISTYLILSDVKPSGPYGKYFKEKMIDPTRNCSFSLRSLAKEKRNPRTGVADRSIVSMVTFDAGMASGGYKEASKRYKVGNESVSIDVVQEDIVAVRSVVTESFFDSSLNEFFKSNKVMIDKESTSYYMVDDVLHRDDNDTRGIIHTLLRRNK